MKEYMKLLGMKVKDRVTGLEGVVASVCFDLYGCVQVIVVPAAEGDKCIDGRWLDHKRLKVLSKKPVMDVPVFEAPGAENGPTDKPAFSHVQ